MKKKLFQGIAAAACLLTIAFTATGCDFLDTLFGIVKDANTDHVHVMTYFEAKEATCISVGNKAYWYCEGCKKNFRDEQGTQEYSQTDLYIPLKSHTLSYHERVESTCTHHGTEAHYSCIFCKNKFADAQGGVYAGPVELPLEPHTLTFVEGNPATCTDDGVRAHYTCSVCHNHFEDENALKAMSEKETVLPADHAYAAEWSYDEKAHWREVLCEHKGMLLKEIHDFGGGNEDTCAVCGYTKPSAGLIYTVNESAGTASLTGIGDCTKQNIRVAETYMGYPVTAVADDALLGCDQLASVTLPAGLVSIGASAFENCFNLQTVSIPVGVTEIGSSAFAGCKNLSSVALPAGLTSVEGSAFSYCIALESIAIPSSVQTIKAWAFAGCTNLKTVVLSDGLTAIGGNAFVGCTGLKTIVLPHSVASLGENAFSGCEDLTDLTIGSGVETIGNAAFKNCYALANVTLGTNSKMKSIGNEAFYACRKLTKFVFPKGLESIGSRAFDGCIGLKRVDIPYSVTTIGSKAFTLLSLQIYTEVTRRPDGWASDWANGNTNVHWG